MSPNLVAAKRARVEKEVSSTRLHPRPRLRLTKDHVPLLEPLGEVKVGGLNLDEGVGVYGLLRLRRQLEVERRYERDVKGV